MKDEIKYTDEWELLECGKDYLRKKNIYSDVDKCHRFYNGDQWQGLESGGIEPITYNIIKPIVKYKTGVINANGYDIIFMPNNYDNAEFQKEMQTLCKHLNKYAGMVIENQKIDHKAKKVIKQSGITSEGILYFDYKDDETVAEVVSKTNIYYGNENDDDIQSQPYMLITFRRTVDEVKNVAEENKKNKLNKLSKEDINNIVGDTETDDLAGDYSKDEVHNMITCVLKLYKKNGTVHIKQSTKNICFEEERDTGLKYYPVAHYTWDDEEGSARGIGIVKPITPNQIEVNKTAMRRAIAVKMGAYPKLVADVDKITNPSALNEIGTTIRVSDTTIDDVKKVIGYLQPATMSMDSEKLQNELISQTRELEGAGDVATGDINPEQASGRAILAIQQASKEPLNEQVAKFKNFMEDVARIMVDMWKTYSADGKEILIENDDNDLEPYKISSTVLENLELNFKIEVTPKTPFDKYAQEMSLENLLMNQLITFEEYVGALPEDSAMPKGKLESMLQKREEVKQEIAEAQNQVNEANAQIEEILQEEMMNAEQSDSEINQIESKANQTNELIGGRLNEMSGM